MRGRHLPALEVSAADPAKERGNRDFPLRRLAGTGGRGEGEEVLGEREEVGEGVLGQRE